MSFKSTHISKISQCSIHFAGPCISAQPASNFYLPRNLYEYLSSISQISFLFFMTTIISTYKFLTSTILFHELLCNLNNFFKIRTTKNISQLWRKYTRSGLLLEFSKTFPISTRLLLSIVINIMKYSKSLWWS